MLSFHPLHDDEDQVEAPAGCREDNETRMGVILLGVAALATGVYSLFYFAAM